MPKKSIRYIRAAYRLAAWALIYRKRGLPITFFNDDKYLEWFKGYRKQLEKYKDIHKGQDCFIIGNGPSLNQTDLELLNDYHTIGLNKINLIFETRKINLSYHVAVNSLVIEQISKELSENVFNCKSFIPFHRANDSLKGLHNLEYIITENTPWTFSTSILGPISEGYTVTFVAMQLAYFMGFHRVFLVGVDHNFQQSGSPNQEQILVGPDINHFHPDYFSGQKWHLADLEGNEVSYQMAKYFFRKDNRSILDATVNGKLQIFDRILFQDALSLAKNKV